MNKVFAKESDNEDDEQDDGAEEPARAQPAWIKNYITPHGLQRLRDELRFLLTRERPAVTQVVAWAAGNGDRSENADYQYGKRRLRQIDRRIHFLTKRIDAAHVVDPEAPRTGRAATLVVTAEDALRPDSGQAHQGDFSPGSTVTMWLQGYYSVASAESGLLSLRISDQTRTISTTTPIVVTRGGDFFLLSSTFAIPEDSVEVCRTAILRVGSVTIAEPQSKSFPLWCIPIRR